MLAVTSLIWTQATYHVLVPALSSLISSAMRNLLLEYYFSGGDRKICEVLIRQDFLFWIKRFCSVPYDSRFEAPDPWINQLSYRTYELHGVIHHLADSSLGVSTYLIPINLTP